MEYLFFFSRIRGRKFAGEKRKLFERRSTRSIPLRFSWNCLCTVGFKRNNCGPERYRLQFEPIDRRSSLDENAIGNGLDSRRRVFDGNQRKGEFSKRAARPPGSGPGFLDG